MRIAIAQINSTLGDFEGNKLKIIEFIKRAVSKRSDLVVFPECALFGYHPFDLLERREAVAHQQNLLKEIKRNIPKHVAVLFGLITKNKSKLGRPFFNSAVLMTKKSAPQFFHKELLPTGDIFDESRFVEPGQLSNNYFDWNGKRFFVTICEDIWAWPNSRGESIYANNPLDKIKIKKVDLVLNLSASPYFGGKFKLRQEVVAKTAKKFKAPMAYINLVGAQDEIIFDGGSFVVNSAGKKVVDCLKFQEDLNIFDLDTLESWNPSVEVNEIEELRQALVLGIRDFCSKTGIQKIHLGLSGGIDSAVVACLAADAMGPGAITALALPGPFNATESLTFAQQLANNLKIHFQSVHIGNIFKSFCSELENKLSVKSFSIVHENLQSRIRGNLLMAFANIHNSLLLNTGNKSEYATGYCTLYGDTCGGLAPIGDLTKEQVVKLALHYNSDVELIPKFIIERPPSAELRPHQTDQDSLPSYKKVDAAVINIVEKCLPPKNATEKWLLQKIMQTEFKRWQAAPILKVSSHSFGRGRRFPIAHKITKF